MAPTLLGAHLHAFGVTVRLTEVEAYGGVGEDPGSHAHRGRTPRTGVMFGPPGRSYVYFTYGMHWCLNVVVGPAGRAAAVLLRAGEVVDGLDRARSRRPGVRDRDLCRGPARLTRTLAVTGEHDGLDLLDPRSAVRLLSSEADAADASARAAGADDGAAGTAGLPLVRCGPRVGVAGAGATTAWRWWLDQEPSVSPYRPAVPRRRPPVPPGLVGP